MKTRLREFSRGLAFRIAILLALALLPVGAISIYQTLQLVGEANEQAEDALLAVASDAAAREAGLIRTAIGAGQAIGAIAPDMGDDPQVCAAELGEYVRASGHYTFAAFVTADGQLCSSRGDVRDASDARIFQSMLGAKAPHVDLVTSKMLDDTPSIVVSVPINNGGDTFAGFVSIALPQTRLFSRLDEITTDRPVDVITFNAKGQILSAEAGLKNVDARLPEGRPLDTFVGEMANAFTDVTPAGERRVFAMVPLVTGTVYALASWDDTSLAFQPGLWNLVMPVLFPLLMWLASLVVAFLAVQRLVIRPTRNLRARMLLFMRSRQISPPKYDRLVSTELRDIDETWNRMAESVLRDEAEMEDMLHDKTVLLKEVHHRVKNNLQLIVSILNMKIRRTSAPEAKSVLQDVQHRVMSMATVHQHLYETSDEGRVRMDELMGAIVDHVTAALLPPESGIEVQQDYQRVVLYPDQAVPLTLAATEALTNALKYVGRPASGTPWITIRLINDGDSSAVLEIGNSLGVSPPGFSDPEGSGMGEQLIRAFAAQLDGVLSAEEDAERHIVRLRFPIGSFVQEVA